MNIFASNPDTTNLERTYLSRSTASGDTVFKVKNSDRFVADQKVLVGAMGRERSEIRTIASLTATELTLDAADFPHDSDDPVYAIQYDQMKVYRSTTGIAGSYSVLATVDLDVDNANNKTTYQDLTALDTYYYKISFYDSVNDEESDLTDPIPATGYAYNQLGAIISEVARKVKDIDFQEIAAEVHIANANDISIDLQTQAKRPYRFLKRNTQLDIDADASTIDFPDDFWKVNYVEVNEVGPAASRTFRPKKVSATEARFQLTQSSTPGDYVDMIAFDDEADQMIVVPAARLERLNAFNFHYYKTFDQFTSFSSTIEGPTRLAYKLGLLRECYMSKADDDDKYLKKADSYDRKYNTEVMKLQREKSIEAGGPSGMAPDRKKYPQWGGRKYRQ